MRSVILGIVAICWVTLAGADDQTASDPLSKDPRLGGKLTLSRRHVRLGEFVEEVSSKTGVRLEVDDRLGPASGFVLTAEFRDRSAWQILAALPRLYSAPPDRWYWEGSGRGETARYSLRHTLPVEAAGSAREAFIENWLLDQHQRITAFAAMGPDERRKFAAEDPFLQALDVNAGRSFGKASILGLLSEQELRSALRGNAVDIPLSRLSQQQLDWWRREHEYYMDAPDEGVHSLTIRRSPGQGSLELNLGRVTVSALGGVWIQKPLEQYGERSWLVADEQVRPNDPSFPAPGVRFRPEEVRFESVSDSAHASKLARLGAVDVLLDQSRAGLHSGSGRPGPKLSDALAVLRGLGLLSKQWDGIYLLRPRDWPTRSTRSLIAWPVLRELRRRAEAGGGYLRPEDWLAISELSQAQLAGIQEEFPDTAYLLQFQPLFRLAAAMSDRERELLSRHEGAGWQDLSSATRQRMLALFAAADARNVRFLLQWSTDPFPPRARLYSGTEQPQPLVLEFKRWQKLDPKAEEKPPVRSD